MKTLDWRFIALVALLFAGLLLAFPPYRIVPAFEGRAVVRFNALTGHAELCLPENDGLTCRGQVDRKLVPIQ